MRYYIQYEFNGIVRRKVFSSPAQAGNFANYIRNIEGIGDVSRVLEAA